VQANDRDVYNTLLELQEIFVRQNRKFIPDDKLEEVNTNRIQLEIVEDKDWYKRMKPIYRQYLETEVLPDVVQNAWPEVLERLKKYYPEGQAPTDKSQITQSDIRKLAYDDANVNIPLPSDRAVTIGNKIYMKRSEVTENSYAGALAHELCHIYESKLWKSLMRMLQYRGSREAGMVSEGLAGLFGADVVSEWFSGGALHLLIPSTSYGKEYDSAAARFMRAVGKSGIGIRNTKDAYLGNDIQWNNEFEPELSIKFGRQKYKGEKGKTIKWPWYQRKGAPIKIPAPQNKPSPKPATPGRRTRLQELLQKFHPNQMQTELKNQQQSLRQTLAFARQQQEFDGRLRNRINAEYDIIRKMQSNASIAGTPGLAQQIRRISGTLANFQNQQQMTMKNAAQMEATTRRAYQELEPYYRRYSGANLRTVAHETIKRDYRSSLSIFLQAQKQIKDISKGVKMEDMPFKINRSWEFQIKQNPIYKKQRDQFIPRVDPGSFGSGDTFV
jgi:hypothetical protein